MANNFKVGELVQLKSGGPKMTVNALYNNYVECAWFTGSKANKANFQPDSLQYFKEEEKK
ncbi:YodC family protein [Methylobacterium brachythecii]|uniref:Uncharacterized protein YodC (DUF2158 family) n=1 Tax=Methylobacterium brachythecii TaxID=1176177 RepID=A0A7W6AH47_9HYPH|nr:DUF2158 domain-containing protein [Methylobacterium brachythecii]MBB3901350.1 uncharacterized protein YodC (DUF2158 family) [Methylobacterium brachythecii]GLS42925.1 hypothetical protein GCM10007884_09100 [Methylobacterium brachythecii]